MVPNRNDPCPCGSGRKYKHCCLRRAEAEATTTSLRPEIRQAASTAGWEADILPFPFVEESRAKGGAVIFLATSGGFVLHMDIFDHPGSEPFQVAAALAERVRVAIEAVGAVPTRLRVGDVEVAGLLRPLLSGVGVSRIEAGALAEVAEVARSTFRHVAGEDVWPPGGSREAWRHWGRTGEEIAALFRAAAAFHRAAPWRTLSSSRLLAATTPAGRGWALSIMGSGGDEYGLAVFSDIEDFLALMEVGFEDVWARQRGRHYGVIYGSRSELPRPMQKEVAVAGWEVAGPDAYPVLLSVRSPGGGVCAADWADLVTMLDAVPRAVEAGAEWGRGGHVFEDHASGVTFVLLPDFEDPGHDLPPLAPGCAEGPGADPQAAVEGDVAPELDHGLVYAFRAWLAARHLSSATLDKHTRNAVALLHYLNVVADVPLRAIHEFDLRDFLFDWIHRKTALPATVVRSAPASLGKFFRFLKDERGIKLPCADDVLADRERFLERAETCPGGPFWDEATRAWIAELTTDLDLRVMLPSDALGDDDEWGERMGPLEWALHRQMRRRWLLWRDELLREGLTEHDALRAELEARQRAWQAAPNERADGRTPVEAVRTEREQAATRGRTPG